MSVIGECGLQCIVMGSSRPRESQLRGVMRMFEKKPLGPSVWALG